MEPYAHYFFPPESGFEFPMQCIARGVGTGYADLGEILYTARRVVAGDYRSWIDEWTNLAQRTRDAARSAERHGRTVSARNAYRRACNYFGATYREHLAFDDWAAFRHAFVRHRECWDRACALNDPPIERRSVTVGEHDMNAWFHPASPDGEPRPTLIYFSGADALITETAPHALAASARGFNLVAVEGPGQGATLMDLGVPFRHDWEHVIAPSIDAIETWPEVDSGNLFLYGASQGGYFCLRGACGEPRLRGVILDPPVHDVSTVIQVSMARIGAAIEHAAASGSADPFEAAKQSSPAMRQMLNWRPFGYGSDGPGNPMERMVDFRVDDDRLSTLTAPLLLLDPTGEHFWPNQGLELQQRAPVAVTRAVLTEPQGADSHCQPLAPANVAEIMFDWMSELIVDPVSVGGGL
jgi:alpha-beta hydrolase superfamily lysophospholipase